MELPKVPYGHGASPTAFFESPRCFGRAGLRKIITKFIQIGIKPRYRTSLFLLREKEALVVPL